MTNLLDTNPCNLGRAATMHNVVNALRYGVTGALAALETLKLDAEDAGLPPAVLAESARRVELAFQHLLLVVENSSLAVDLNRILRRRSGAASVELLAHVAYARRRLATAPTPDLVIIDHDLSDASGADLAVWMLTQPALASAVRVSYSGRETDAIFAELRTRLADDNLEAVPAERVFHACITKPDFGLVDTLGAIMRRVRTEQTESDSMLSGATQ